MGIEDTGLGVEYSSGNDFYDHILNDLFLPAVADTVITPNTLLERLVRDKERVEGKNVVFPIHTGRNYGVNAIAAGGDLPDADNQDYDGYSFPVRHVYGRVKFDGITADASRTQMAAWLKVIESEVKGLGTDMSRYKQRACHLEGSGVIAETDSIGTAAVTAGTEINTIPVDIWPESTVAIAPELSETKYLRVGQRVALVDKSTDAYVVSSTIATVTDNTSFTLADTTGTLPTTGSYYVVLAAAVNAAGVIADTSYGVDPMGIAGIVDDSNPDSGNFQGVNADTAGNEWHRATVNSAAADRALTLALMDEAFTDAMENGDVAPTSLVTSFAISRKYAALLLADRRYVGTTDYDGGYKALDYNGAPMIADRDCLNNRIYFLHEPDIRVYTMADPQWMQKDGSIYHRITDKDAYQACLYCRETMGSDVRDKHVLLGAITEA